MRKSKKSSVKTSRAASVGRPAPTGTIGDVPTNEIFERLWCALPTVQQALIEKGPQPEEAEDAPFVPFGENLSIPYPEMRDLSAALFMATHANPISNDVQYFVDEKVGAEAQPLRNSFDKKFCNDLFEQMVMDHLSRQLGNHSDGEIDYLTIKRTMSEIIDCVTNDEEPFQLLAPSAVLRITSATLLTNTVESFVKLEEHRRYPLVFDEIWSTLQDKEQPVASLSKEEFTVFFSWFYRLHVENSSQNRCEAASVPIWKKYRNEKGVMSMISFQNACEHLCKVYAKRDDTAVYLEVIFSKTKELLQEKGMETNGMVFFAAPSEILREISNPFHLSEPTQLYMPQRLQPWEQVKRPFAQPFSSNRIVLWGKMDVGKTSLGEALAKTLRSVHLDTLSIALDLLKTAKMEGVYRNDLAQHVNMLIEKEAPIPLDLQAQLIREAISSSKTYYHGYVFSDVVSFSQDNQEECLAFYEKCGLLDVAQPSSFVELLCEDEYVYGSHLKNVLEKREILSRNALNTSPEHDREEKKRMIRECTMIIENYEALSAKEEGVSEEELQEAKLQTEEAKEILASLQNESALEADAQDGEKEEAEDIEAKKQAEIENFKTKVSALLRLGRSNLLNGKEVSLRTLPPFKALLENAASREQTLSLNCFSSTTDSIAYIQEALHLQMVTVATDIKLDDDQQPDTPTNYKEEQQLGGLLEEAATNQGILFSPIWKKFCPVTFLEDSVLVEGAFCYSSVFESNAYLAASEEKKERFRANPIRYLSQTPVDRLPIFLLADPKIVAKINSHGEKANFVSKVSEAMKLTPVLLREFHSNVEEFCKLRDSRAAVYKTREEFELTERKARQERAEKRRKAEAKHNKKKGKDKQSAVTFGEEPENSKKEGQSDKNTKAQLRLQDEIQTKIEVILEERADLVPVLITAVDQEDSDSSFLNLLLEENKLPKHVIVLEEEKEISSQDNLDEPAETEQENESPSSLSIFSEMIQTLENHSSKSNSEVVVHHITINNKTLENLVHEVDVTVNPAAATVIDGYVDEELGQEEEDADEEEEDFMEGEADEDENAPPRLPKPPVHPLLKPRRRFDHQFGAMLQYCPVTYKQKGILVKGQNEFCSEYYGKLYLFTSEENKDLFSKYPLTYLSNVNIHNTPPRVWIVGPTHSGKMTLAKQLQEQYDVSVFSYDRTFFENCIEAALLPRGNYVNDIFVKKQSFDNAYLKRAYDILTEVRRIRDEEEQNLRLRDEAIKKLEELEAKREDEDYEDEINEEEEEKLREQSEFEPEDEEEKQIRLSESYLRIASCVVRIEPFESKGYIMIIPPFSEGDLDILFPEGGVPEVVLHMNLSKEEFCARGRSVFNEKRKKSFDLVTTLKEEKEKHLSQEDKKRIKREKKLRKWRRRNIGKDDPDTDDEGQADGARNAGDKEEENNLAEPDYEGTAVLQFEAVDEFLNGIEERRIDIVKLSADLAPGAVFHAAVIQLNRHYACRSSLLCIPEVVTLDNAEKLIHSGKFHLSHFGTTDPVGLYEKRNGKRRVCKWKPNGFSCAEEPEKVRDGDESEEGTDGNAKNPADPLDGEEDEVSIYGSEDLDEMRLRAERRKLREKNEKGPRTVILGPFVYYLESDDNLMSFMKHPILYLEQAPPTPVLPVQPVVAVYEDDVFPNASSKDTTSGVKRRGLGESIAFNVGSVFISAAKLLSWAARQPCLGPLCSRAVVDSLSGTISDELLTALLRERLSSADVKRRGAVLVNLPRSKNQVKELTIRSGSCAPLCKVASVCAKGERISQATELKQALHRFANVRWEAPYSTVPVHPANLNELVLQLDTFTAAEADAHVRRMNAFPVSLSDVYYTLESLRSNLSEYQSFCPYRWVENGDLVRVNIEPPAFGASFLGKYYVFSSKDYLDQFMDDPLPIADPSKLKPLPPNLPEEVKGPVAASQLEFQGCCPVLLHDTEGRKGLRGVPDAVAQKGSMDHLVKYNGKTYALLNSTNKERFLMRPWQYVEAAAMPQFHKCPLAEGRSPSNVKDEEYVRRYLYESVARAMAHVGATRPLYPDCSPEESALKFLALHLKAHNSAENNDIQSAQYAENFEVFSRRAQLYRATAGAALEDSMTKKEFDAICQEYENLQRGFKSLHTLPQLRKNAINKK